MHSFIPPSGSETTRGPGRDAPPAPRVAHRYFHRLDRFDPTSESSECFERRFNEFADHFGWPEGSKLFNLKQCVPRESEGTLYASDRVDSFTSLFQALRERYGKKQHTATLRRLELQGLQRKPGDSLTSLFHDITRLTSLAWPDELSTDAVMGTQIDAFVKATGSPLLRREILMRALATLEQALDIAVQVEAIELSAGRVSGPGDRGAQLGPGREGFPPSQEFARLRGEVAELQCWKRQTQRENVNPVKRKGGKLAQ